MTPSEAKAVFDVNGNRPILVRTRSGAEYWVCEDCVSVGSDEYTADDAYVYGTRANGSISLRGRRRVDTRNQTRWFNLSNVKLVGHVLTGHFEELP